MMVKVPRLRSKAAVSRQRWVRSFTTISSVLLQAVCIFGQTSGPFEQAVEQATAAQRSGNIALAIRSYREALTIRPEAAELWSNLGLMQHEQKDFSAAADSFAHAHKLAPKLFVPVFFLGVENLEQSKPEKAIDYLTLAQKLSPQDPHVLQYLGRAYFSNKQYKEAASTYSKILSKSPLDGEVWYRLGLSHLGLAELDSAVLASTYKSTSYFRSLEGATYSSQNHPDHAVTSFQQGLKIQPQPPCMRSGLGWALIRQGKLNEAEVEFELDRQKGCLDGVLGMIRVAYERDKTPSPLNELQDLWLANQGYVLTRGSLLTSGMTNDGLNRLEQDLSKVTYTNVRPPDASRIPLAIFGGETLPVAESSPSAAAARTRLQSTDARSSTCNERSSSTARPAGPSLEIAPCLFFAGDFVGVSKTAEELKRSPTRRAEGLYWSILAHQNLATQDLVRAEQVEPDSVRIRVLLAETYRDMENYAAAEKEYQTALRLDPDNFASMVGAAATYLQEGSFNQAKTMIGNALAMRPDDPEANYIAGEVAVEERRFDDGERYLTIALRANVQLVPRVHALMGRIFAVKGDNERAVEELRLGLSSDDDGSTHFQLARLYQKLGRTNEAKQLLAETQKIQQKNHPPAD